MKRTICTIAIVCALIAAVAAPAQAAKKPSVSDWKLALASWTVQHYDDHGRMPWSPGGWAEGFNPHTPGWGKPARALTKYMQTHLYLPETGVLRWPERKVLRPYLLDVRPTTKKVAL